MSVKSKVRGSLCMLKKYTCRFYIMGKVTVLNYANSRS